MIPKRNLLKEKLGDSSRYRLAQTVTCLLKQGPALLYSCETIIRHINLSTEELATFKKKLALIELYNLIEHSGIHFVGYRGADPRSSTLSWIIA